MIETVKLGDMIEFQRGYDLPKSKVIPGPYPVETASEISAYHNNYKAENTIILGRSGTVGNPRLIRGKFWPLNTTLYATSLKGNDVVYMYYLLQNLHVEKMVTGSTVPTLNRNDLYPLTIKAETDVAIQKKIGRVLESIDQKMNNNNAISSRLESLTKTIYDYWFLQFNFPDENDRPYKSSGGKMVWNEELKREIPEGWKSEKFADLIKQTKNGDWGEGVCDEQHPHKVRCLRGADFPAVAGSDSLHAPFRYISEKSIDKLLSVGDIIVEISGGSPTQSTGRSCLVSKFTLNRFGSDIVTSNFCKAITLSNKAYCEWFYETWKAMYYNGVFFNYEGKTTGIKNLLFDAAISQINVIVPPEPIACKYHKMANNIFETMQANNIMNDQLSSLRDFLLPMLMNGQITFKEDA